MSAVQDKSGTGNHLAFIIPLHTTIRAKGPAVGEIPHLDCNRSCHPRFKAAGYVEGITKWEIMPDRNVWRAGRKIASVAALSVALLGIGIGAGVSQAATVPPGSHTAIIVMTNENTLRPVDYTLQNAGPFGGTSGALPVGDGEVYDIHWTNVTAVMAWGTGRYWWGRMGSYRNGPVDIAVATAGGREYPFRYIQMNITLTQSWYGTTRGAYPAYGHGAHHTFAHTVVASDDPTTNLYKI
jgi:hypothetical protein